MSVSSAKGKNTSGTRAKAFDDVAKRVREDKKLVKKHTNISGTTDVPIARHSSQGVRKDELYKDPAEEVERQRNWDSGAEKTERLKEVGKLARKQPKKVPISRPAHKSDEDIKSENIKQHNLKSTEEVFQRVHMEQNGTVLENKRNSAEKKRPTGLSKNESSALFKAMDSNKDGFLSKNELQAVLGGSKGNKAKGTLANGTHFMSL